MLQRGSLLLRLASVRSPTQAASNTSMQTHSAVGLQAGRCLAAAAAPASSLVDLPPEEQRKKLVGALLYRSKQRGFLELDLLVGLWAQKHLPAMELPALRNFSAVLEEENPDLFKWLTGQEEPSQHMAQNTAFQAMRRDIAKQLQETRPQRSATAPGKTWLRGWDDWKKEQAPATA